MSELLGPGSVRMRHTARQHTGGVEHNANAPKSSLQQYYVVRVPKHWLFESGRLPSNEGIAYPYNCSLPADWK